jgi:NAD(P)-dependent dehydrogenase (short-subunit alcohol dehydrogenase family)
MKEFKNKNIIVLGGSKGIGLEIVKHLIKLKANVIIISRSKPKLNYKHVFFKCNFENENEMKIVIQKIKKNYNKFFSIINCIAITLPTQNKLQPNDKFYKTLDINLLKFYFFISNTYNKIENKGSILNISSIYADLAFPNNPSYSVSKAGINALTRSLAEDLSYKKIRVNSISAGYIKSNMTEKSFNDKKRRAHIIKQNLLKRWGTVNEIAMPAIFLISYSASFITGQNIIIDGGWTIKGLVE